MLPFLTRHESHNCMRNYYSLTSQLFTVFEYPKGTKWESHWRGINGNLVVEVASRKIPEGYGVADLRGKRTSVTAECYLLYSLETLKLSSLMHHDVHKLINPSRNDHGVVHRFVLIIEFVNSCWKIKKIFFSIFRIWLVGGTALTNQKPCSSSTYRICI